MKNTNKNLSIKNIKILTLALTPVMLFFFLMPSNMVFADTPLYANCTAVPYNSNVGDSVNWQVQNISGGNGVYTYSWNGTDGLVGNNQTIYKTYTYSGSKTANVFISSGGQNFTASCSTNIGSSNNYNNYNGNNNGYNNGTLIASCYSLPGNPKINDTVTWYGTATGGNGNYTYSWSGTDSLSGNISPVYKSYSTPGTKTAFLTISSNGQTVTQTCSANIANSYNGNYNNGYNNGYYTGYGYNNGYNNNNSNGGFTPTSNQNNNSYYNNPPINSSGYVQTSPIYQTYTYPVVSYPPVYSNNYGTYNNNIGTPVSGVFLNQVPSTGISAQNIKMSLFVIGLFAWSLFAAFVIRQKRKALSTGSHNLAIDQRAKIEAFKKINLSKKNLLK